MKEKDQIRNKLKEQLTENKAKMLDNSVDKQLALKIMQEFSEITLFLTSFEFTQKIIEDPTFMKEIMEQIEKEGK